MMIVRPTIVLAAVALLTAIASPALADPREVLLFAGRSGQKPGDANFALVRETPLLEEAIVHVVARVVRTYWGGDHSLFLGQVEYARYGEGRPLR